MITYLNHTIWVSGNCWVHKKTAGTMRRIEIVQKKFENLLRESEVLDVWRVCDLVLFEFKSKEGAVIRLHVSGDLRIVDDENLLASYFDMHEPGTNYKKKIFRKFKYDEPGHTLFDDQLKSIIDRLKGAKVLNVKFERKDLFLKLDNNIKIEVPQYTLKADQEFYRLFVKGDLDSHFIVENP